MNVLFENITIYTKENLLKFEKFHINRVHFVSFLIYIIACVIILVSATFLIILKEWNGIVFLILGIFFVIYRFSIPYLYTSRILKSDKMSEGLENKTEFSEDSMKVTNNISTSDIPYDKLFKVYESIDCFYLYINKLQAFIVKKESFTLGNSSEFSKFIQGKLNNNFKKLI